MQIHLHEGMTHSHAANLTNKAGEQIVNLKMSRTNALARVEILAINNYLRTIS